MPTDPASSLPIYGFDSARNCAAAIIVGDGGACETVVLTDSRLTDIAATKTAITFDLATDCGWLRGAVSGNSSSGTYPVAFTANARSCFVEGANLSGIGAEPKVSITSGATYRLADNRGSVQRTPIGLGQRVTVALNAGTHTLAVSSSFVAVDGGSGSSAQALNTINGGQDGDLLVLTKAATGANVQVNAGSTIHLASGTSFPLTSQYDALTLIKRGSDWVEIARSDNG